MRPLFKACLVVVTFISPALASAEDCASVLALSRNQNSTLSSSSDVRLNATNFCKEYSSGNSKSRSSGFSARYKALAGSFSGSKASESEVASKFCSASDLSSAADNAYEIYVDNIAPGAFSAYQQCISNKVIDFAIDPNSVLPNQFSMIVTFKQAGQQTANLLASPSQGVVCTWDDGISNKVAVTSPGSTTLNCKRTDAATKSFVAVAFQNGSGKITVPWAAYTKEGVPIDLVQRLRDEVSSLGTEVAEAKAETAKARAALNAIATSATVTKMRFPGVASCPPGSVVSGLSDPEQHGPKHNSPYALKFFQIVCMPLK